VHVAVARVDVNVWVTSVYQMQKIMYNNYREPKGSFTHSLRDTDIHLAATLHPVKNASFHYRLHKYFLMHDSLRHLRTRLSELQRQLNDVSDELKVIVTSKLYINFINFQILLSWSYNVPFQHKYGYIRDEIFKYHA